MKRLYKIIAKRAHITLTDQRGVALFASLMILTSLAVLGLWGVNSNLIDYRVTTNYRDHTQSYYAAEAGLERAREYLRGLNYNTELQNAAGSDNQLVNSTNINNFPGDDVPIYSGQTIGGSSYTVYITNDANDGVTNSNDTNGRITITAFGTGPDGSTSVVQAIVSNSPISLSPPAPIVIPGPDVQRFDAGWSNAWNISGDDAAGGSNVPGIVVSNSTARNTVVHDLGYRADQVTSGGQSPAVEARPDLLAQSGLDNISSVHDMLNNIKARADFTSTSDPGFNLGTQDNPEVVFIDGSFDTRRYGNSGYGILVVTNKLTLRGNFSYNGVIMVIGRGELYRTGSGNGVIQGSIILADIDGRDNQPFTADDRFEEANFDTNGGGTGSIIFNSDWANNPLQNDAPRIISIAQKYGQ